MLKAKFWHKSYFTRVLNPGDQSCSMLLLNSHDLISLVSQVSISGCDLVSWSWWWWQPELVVLENLSDFNSVLHLKEFCLVLFTMRTKSGRDSYFLVRYVQSEHPFNAQTKIPVSSFRSDALDQGKRNPLEKWRALMHFTLKRTVYSLSPSFPLTLLNPPTNYSSFSFSNSSYDLTLGNKQRSNDGGKDTSLTQQRNQSNV
jgi:hypothetical protein